MTSSIYFAPENKVTGKTPAGLCAEKAYYFAGQSGLHVLEIGCAGHEIGQYLQNLGHTFTGFDLRSNAADWHGDMNCLPFNPQSFDAVIFNATLQYSSNPLTTLREINRVLRPGAFMVGSTAFLEPGIWKSLYHTSPRGLHELLRAGYFSVTHIWPSWNVIEALQMAVQHDPQFEGNVELASLLDAVSRGHAFKEFSKSVHYAGGLNFHAIKT